jgi:beta-glucanase (GH16 family)
MPKDRYAPPRLLAVMIVVVVALATPASAAAFTSFAAPAKRALRANGYGHLHVSCSRNGRCNWRGARADRACTGNITVRKRGRWRTRIWGVHCAGPGSAGTWTGTGTAPSIQSHPTCGGESLRPKPSGGTWTCSFDDEFSSATGDASSLNTSWWTPQDTATSGYTTGPLTDRACYVNSTNNISVSGGALHLTARREPGLFLCGLSSLSITQYTSGMVSTSNSFHQTYGRFEVRALLPQTTVAGLQETLWLWPVKDKLFGSWPASGEVDFSEFYSQYSSLDIPYIHYNYNTVNKATNTNVVTNNCQISLSQYNDYAVTWSPGSFQITINGSACLTDNYQPDGGLTSPQPFNQPFFISLTQALGTGTNTFDPSRTPLPATTSIDYVRVWK